MSLDVALALRWVHVVAAALAVGGTVAIGVALGAGTPRVASASAAAAQRFEWLFWAALGLLVATGIGLLARYGAALPGVETEWGAALGLKLATVALLAAVSLVRTLHLVRLELASSDEPRRPLRALYAVSATLGLIVLALAQVLAHG